MNSKSDIPLSLLIPVFNAEKTLKRCLDSALAQGLPGIEIICVDDGSKDRSGIILADYAERDSRFRIITHPENRGLLCARKTAVLTAAGRYIMFLDADDTLTPDACETALRIIIQKNVDIFHFGLEPAWSNPGSYTRNEIHTFFLPHHGELRGNEIFFQCFGEIPSYQPSLVNKIFSANLCGQTFRLLPDIRLVMYEDSLTYFILSVLADSYYGDSSYSLYQYWFGHGITTGTQKQITETQFLEYCRFSEVISFLRCFLEKRRMPQAYYEALNRLHVKLVSAALSKSVLLDHKEFAVNAILSGAGTEERNFRLLLSAVLESVSILQNKCEAYRESASFRLGYFLVSLPERLLACVFGYTEARSMMTALKRFVGNRIRK